MRTCDLSALLELLKDSSVSAAELSRAAAHARRLVRKAPPPESLPPLVCELGALIVHVRILPPYHGLGLIARDPQPIKFGNIRVQREWFAYEVINDIQVATSFPVLGSPQLQHVSDEVDAWKKHNMPLIKKLFKRYLHHTGPLIEQHWEYAILLSLLRDLDRLAEIEHDTDEVRRMLTVIDGSNEMRRRYRGAAGTLHRPPT